MGHNSCSVKLGDEGLWGSSLQKCNNSFPCKTSVCPQGIQSNRLLQKNFRCAFFWKDKEIFLRMEKTASASFVWINGKEVGYNEGAQEPAEYNITDFVKPGRNTIAVNVYKYSDGSSSCRGAPSTRGLTISSERCGRSRVTEVGRDVHQRAVHPGGREALGD